MANPLTASGEKGSLLLVFLFLIFIGLIYYKLYIGAPAIINNFEQQTFTSNYRVFKKAILHAHLHFQIKTQQECFIDCWTRNNIGLDYGTSGYPVASRFTAKNILFSPLDYNEYLTDKDCAQVWSFLMGSIHQSINTKTSNYRANYDQNTSHCIYTDKNVTNFSIIYAATTGTVILLKIDQTNP